MSCRNPKFEFSTKNCETLETKIQNSRNFNLRVVGGALREVIHPYAIFITNVLLLSFGTPKKDRVVGIYGNPRSVIRFCRKEDGLLLKACEMDCSRPIL
jgi:hypothetical protein